MVSPTCISVQELAFLIEISEGKDLVQTWLMAPKEKRNITTQ